ncbi:hypothetical protein, partial [Prevotellamassilia timonensis]
HKIRKIRHLRGAKARCMSERIRAIGAIREHNIRVVLPDSSLCQNGKQVEIITKMIFELCYIEAINNKGYDFLTPSMRHR